jgi:hypothetical protein
VLRLAERVEQFANQLLKQRGIVRQRRFGRRRGRREARKWSVRVHLL